MVQEVFPDGLVAGDGRLQPGDQIIEINGVDMTCATHTQVGKHHQVFYFLHAFVRCYTKIDFKISRNVLYRKYFFSQHHLLLDETYFD